MDDRLGETVDSGGPAAPHVSDRREEMGTAPEASGQGAPRVEDSHAALAAEMRAHVPSGHHRVGLSDWHMLHYAARVEQLGSIGLVREGPRDVAQASARSGENVQSALGRVEEKKAAFLEAAMAWVAWDQGGFRAFKGPQWEWDVEHARKLKTFLDAYRALVESEKESDT